MNWYIFLLVSLTIVFFVIFGFGEKIRILFLRRMWLLSDTEEHQVRDAIRASIDTVSEEYVELPPSIDIGYQKHIQFIMPYIFSVVILALAICIILMQIGGNTTTNWACGIIGTIVGFWLKSRSE